MDLSTISDLDEIRQRLRDFLSQLLPSRWEGVGGLASAEREDFMRWWREVLRENRLVAPGWPREYGGGGLDHRAESVLHEEFTRAGVPLHVSGNDMLGILLLGPTVLRWGTEEQKHYFLRGTVDGEIRWAQGFSEPEAGSDLFNLRTHARLEDGSWIINGHKIWQTAGTTANWIFAMVRTDLGAVGAKGISMMLVPLDQPGVEVRGIKSMTGETEFAEVHFSEARASENHVIGGVNNGGQVAASLLGLERGSGGVGMALGHKLELDRVIDLAHRRGLAGDVGIRRRIAACYARTNVLDSIGRILIDGGDANTFASISKLLVSQYRHQVTELAVDILGPEALVLDGPPGLPTLEAQPRGVHPTSSAAWLNDLQRARPATVYGGSSQIQRNLIGEGLLGLPRESRNRSQTERPKKPQAEVVES